MVDILAKFTFRVPDVVQCMWLCANVVAVVRGIAVWKLSRHRFVISVYNDYRALGRSEREYVVRQNLSVQLLGPRTPMIDEKNINDADETCLKWQA